jgi:hypothetical protein
MTYDSERFAKWSNADIAAQCRAQARDQLDPEYSLFMTEVAKRLAASPQPPAPGAEVVAWISTSAKGGQMIRTASLKWMLIEESESLYCDCGYTISPLYATPPTAEEIARRAREEALEEAARAVDAIWKRGEHCGSLAAVSNTIRALAKPPGETGAAQL